MKRKIWWSVPGTLPIHTRITLHSQHGPIGRTWLAKQFVLILEEYGENGRLIRAKHCGRHGGGNSIKIRAGEMSMGVLCSGTSARAVGFLFPRFSDEMWDMVVHTISGNAALTGSLLTGSFSTDIVDELKQKGIHLIPDHYRSVRAFCHCSDDQNPCIHIAAAWYFLAEILDEDPWVLFLLHGMTREEVLQRIGGHRDKISQPVPDSNEEQLIIQETGIPDSYDASGFFSCMGSADDVLTPVPQRRINPAMLLGPAPFKLGGKNLAKRIEQLYPVISSYAASLLSRE
ncbi:MAG TPA: hypothetical protein PLY78_02595 [Methanospirillum sp.]|nr:hypothetical protein [Methanospirillum sp.]